jgi:signal transduction histidine kinase
MSMMPAPVDLTPILSVHIQSERDVVAARQRARQVSALLGFGDQDQARIATAVSEIARNAHQYAGGGQLDFSISLRSSPQSIWIQVSDRGSGIADLDVILSGRYVSPTGMGLGVVGSSRLMDQFHISSTPGRGTTVLFGKRLPPQARRIEMRDIGRIGGSLVQQPTAGLDQELQRQNRDLLQTLDALRIREMELEKRQEDFARLNVELDETNRGVVALYAELEEKAVALRRADEIKSRFLSHVSHEFRTPVNAVLALTRLLLDRVDGDLSAEQEKQVSYIRDAAQQLAEIVNDLLDLAKVEAGKIEVHSTLIDLSQFLGSTRALMRPLATRETVNLVFEEPEAGLTVYTDESKLGQILRNLISNALKFTQQGEVRVAAHLSKSGDEICITVKDTGIGIAPEDQERIFQEFAQINNPIQRQVKGTGLGLPLSRRLAELMGGSLAVESVVGSGATFTLSLPLVATSPAAPDAGSHGAKRQSDTILVVDDEPTSRYLVRQLLRGTRFRIIEATASEAAERARFEHPALVLLDLVMPDRRGFDVLDDLKNDERTRDIPVVIHTSKTLTEADKERLAGRCLSILPKSEVGRLPALLAIRTVLGEPALFSAEPEFRDNSSYGR